MSTSEALDTLRSRILSRYTMLFLKTWEEERWESELSELAFEIERGLSLIHISEPTRPY